MFRYLVQWKVTAFQPSFQSARWPKISKYCCVLRVAAAPSGPTVAPPDPEPDLLTPRELEVMRLLARGYAYKEIAAELFIGTKTVETHASNVLRKLQLSNRHQLTRWAAERRIL